MINSQWKVGCHLGSVATDRGVMHRRSLSNFDTKYMAAKVFGGRVRVQQTERPTSFNLWMLTPEEKKNARMKGTRAQVEKKEPTPTVVPFDSPLAFV